VYQISKEFRDIEGSICISGSKSESNRLLLLRAYTSYFKILNLSDSDDTKLMISAIESNIKEINVGHAGTAMRFLTAYFSSIAKKSKVLTGSDRMRQRPISILVDALKDMGCDIEYLEKRGFPPLKINGKNIKENLLKINLPDISQEKEELWAMTSDFSPIKSETSSNSDSMPHPNHYKKWFDFLDKIDLRRHLSDVEFNLIEGALKKSNGSVTEASKCLKINRTTLIEKMKKYSIPKLGND